MWSTDIKRASQVSAFEKRTVFKNNTFWQICDGHQETAVVKSMFANNRTVVGVRVLQIGCVVMRIVKSNGHEFGAAVKRVGADKHERIQYYRLQRVAHLESVGINVHARDGTEIEVFDDRSSEGGVADVFNGVGQEEYAFFFFECDIAGRGRVFYRFDGGVIEER